jgi:hypothetical protein
MSDPARRFIDAIAARPDGRAKHTAFIYGLLREPLIDAVFMGAALADEPLTADEMLYIADGWHDT